MPYAAQLRSALETSLEQRIPSAFSPQIRSELPTIPSGIPELDLVLDGGLPLGAITEIIGSLSSGRLTCSHSFIRKVIQAGHVCAWVDVSDSFDPESAASSGLDLDRLLWIRCGESSVNHRLPLSERSLEGNCRHSPDSATPFRSGGSSHPRNEIHGLPEALDTLLRYKPLPSRHRQLGTPGAPNRSLNSKERVEQVASDRLPSRRGASILQQREQNRRSSPIMGVFPSPISDPHKATPSLHQRKPWSRLDQALRATDLLMQAGGFGALVLDLGHVDPQFATRIPLATWFRFRAAAERSRTAFLLLSQHPCAQSSAEVVLRTRLSVPEAGPVLTAVPYTVDRVRQRFTQPTSNIINMRKPQRATVAKWSASTLWSTGR